MRVAVLLILVATGAEVAVVGPASAFEPAMLEWTERIETPRHDHSEAVSSDGLGSIYIAGSYYEKSQDAESFVSRYDETGSLHWTRRLNSPATETTLGVAADAVGNAFFVGFTLGALGGRSAGGSDAYIGSYDAAGNLRWLQQFGTRGIEVANDVAVDGFGCAYVTGAETRALAGPEAGRQSAFIRKYDSDGNLLWSQRISSSYYREGRGIDVDALGNIYMTGIVSQNAPDRGGQIDAFVSKLSPNGTLEWTREIGGLGFDYGYAVSGDGLGNVYFAGSSPPAGSDPASTGDAMFGKFNSAGDLEWIRKFGTERMDIANGISADTAGNIYVSGSVIGLIDGPVIGTGGVFLAKYDPHGNALWTKQFGNNDDQGYGMSTDGSGAIYISGKGYGITFDPILYRLVDPGFLVPEPGSVTLVFISIAMSATFARRRM